MNVIHPTHCKSIGCHNVIDAGQDFCSPCLDQENKFESLSTRYPDEFRDLGDMTEIDTRAVHHLFKIPDHSGLLQQASHTLLMTGTSNTLHRDVRHVKDLLKRWLQLNPEN